MQHFVGSGIRRSGAFLSAPFSLRSLAAHAQQKKPMKSLPKGVKALIAVVSGKGGVGKSTTTVNLAAASAHLGLRVGILDADIYGPSIPTMLGLRGMKPESISSTRSSSSPSTSAASLLIPLEAKHDGGLRIKCMSMGFLIKEDAAAVWRGPMLMKALSQLLTGTAWNTRNASSDAKGNGEEEDLDVLYVDMPPGTGDVQITLSQQAAITGAVIVSTPQDVALRDVKRAVTMLHQVRVPIVGVVENMSTFVCPKCNTATEVFKGSQGDGNLGQKLHMESIAKIPLDPEISFTSDQGMPRVVQDASSEAAVQYLEAAKSIAQFIQKQKLNNL